MPVAGIITEYNPLHYGHVYLLEETRRRLGPETGIICVMSGNFVQRGDFALTEKWARARAAVRSRADLVLELPLPWATASAEGFASGAVGTLRATGLVTHLVFGSEGGDTAPLIRLAEVLASGAFDEVLRRELTRGDSFAAARQRAAAILLSQEETAPLARPNDLLGVEYCKALRGSGIRPLAVPRRGSGHDGGGTDGFSASAIRELIWRGETERALGLMAPAMAEAYRAEQQAGRAPVLWKTCERAILARLRFMDEADFAALDPGREGLHRRFRRAARDAGSLGKLLDAVKTKRYPLARLRRMVLWAYLGLSPVPPEELPYLRPLAFNERGRALLAAMRDTAVLPILTKPAAVRRLPPEAQRLFEEEVRASGLYALAFPDPAAGLSEWRRGPVILRG